MLITAFACVSALLFSIVAGLLGAKDLQQLAFTGLAGNGLLIALQNIESGGNYWVWNGVAIVCAVLAVSHLEKATGTTVKEQKLWRQLFGETLWQLLWNDPRWLRWRGRI